MLPAPFVASDVETPRDGDAVSLGTNGPGGYSSIPKFSPRDTLGSTIAIVR